MLRRREDETERRRWREDLGSPARRNPGSPSASCLSISPIRVSISASRATLAASNCLSRLLGSSETDALRAASRFCHSVTRSCRSRAIAASSGLPVAPRAAIWASDPAASELRAHCAVWNISAASPGSRACSAAARRWAALTSPQNCQLNCSASLFPLPVRAWTAVSVPRSARRVMTPVLRRQKSAAWAQSCCAKYSAAKLLSTTLTPGWSGPNVFSSMVRARLSSGSASA